MSVHKFIVPQEETWVKQVAWMDTDELNQFYINTEKSELFRNIQILSTMSSYPKILVMFEERQNEPTKSD